MRERLVALEQCAGDEPDAGSQATDDEQGTCGETWPVERLHWDGEYGLADPVARSVERVLHSFRHKTQCHGEIHVQGDTTSFSSMIRERLQ